MESNPFSRRRLLLLLVGGLAALALLRAYLEFLSRHQLRLLDWFADHPAWLIPLLALAVVAASLAAWLTRRAGAHRMAVPVAVLAGALATSLHNSVMGSAVGLLVGVLTAFPQFRRLIWIATRFLVCSMVMVAMAGVTGLFGRASYYSGSPSAIPASVMVYALGAVMVLAVGLSAVGVPRWLAGRRAWPMRDGDRSASRGRRLITAPLTVALAIACLAVGIWIGWQLDVQRRVAILSPIGFWQAQYSYRPAWTIFPSVPREMMLGSSIRDEHLRLLPGLCGITHLVLSDAQISDDAFRSLRSLKNLSSLALYNVPVHDAGIRHLAGMQSLRTVWIEGVPVTREVFHLLPTWPALTECTIIGIQPKGPRLNNITLPPRLDRIRWSGCGLTDDDLAPLSKQRWVASLMLPNNQIQGPGLVHLATQLRLWSVDLTGNPIDDRYLVNLCGQGISVLNLNEIRLTDAGIDALAQMRWLSQLSVRDSGISAPQLRRIVGATQLQRADVDAINLSPRAMIGWRSLVSLELHVDRRTLEAADIARLAELRDIVFIDDCELTPGAVAEFAHHAGPFSQTQFSVSNCRFEQRFFGPVMRYVNMH